MEPEPWSGFSGWLNPAGVGDTLGFSSTEFNFCDFCQSLWVSCRTGGSRSQSLMHVFPNPPLPSSGFSASLDKALLF